LKNDALTIAIPTRNGARTIADALASVTGQLCPGDELVVIDDGSTDDTARVVRHWLSSHNRSGRLIQIDHSGLSAARNCALGAADTDVVCFLDDDELAGDGWVQNLRAAWRRAGDRVGVVGGPMRAMWPEERPVWLHDDLLHVVTVLDLGPRRHKLDQGAFTGYVWGGNMSVRVEAANQVGEFDETLGPRPGQVISASRGEEEEFQDRLAAAGWEVWYEPSAQIRHRIAPERLRASYFRQTYKRAAVLDLQAGKYRAAGAFAVLKAVARLPRALIQPGRGDLVLATFDATYGFTRLFGRVTP
jgi:glucosyl-dolichyl phosphate glucuronosyltransferase